MERELKKRVYYLIIVILTGDITDKRFTQQKISLLTIIQGIQEEWPLSMEN